MSLKKIIRGLQRELRVKDRVRENLLSTSRKVVRLSKQAVMSIHRGNLDEADNRLGEARKMLEELKKALEPHPDLVHSGSLSAAYQEYVEANVLLKLVREEVPPKPDDLAVPSISYLLGLADVVGELRRRALDSLRKGDLETAEKSLKIMEDIYMELISLESSYGLASNLRRKCDVARHIIEATRGDVTTEVRRGLLEKSIESLQKTIGGKKELGKAKTKRHSQEG